MEATSFSFIWGSVVSGLVFSFLTDVDFCLILEMLKKMELPTRKKGFSQGEKVTHFQTNTHFLSFPHA